MLADGQPLSEEEAVVLISALERYVYHLPFMDQTNSMTIDGPTAAHESFLQWATDTCVRNVDRYEQLKQARLARIQNLQEWEQASGLVGFERNQNEKEKAGS